MKKILAFSLFLATSLFSADTFAQDINEIVKNHIEAVGGKENWMKIKSMRKEMNMKAQGAEIKITSSVVDKKGMRIDVAVMGMNGYQILTDKDGWNFMPFQGQTKPEPVTEDDVKNGQDDLSIADELMTYTDFGKKIELLGSDEIEGSECHKISLTDKNNKVTTYFVDKGNHHILKEVNKITANGKEMEMTTVFSDYKKLPEGIVVAMKEASDFGEMEVSNVEVNPSIDMAIFKPSETGTK